MPSPACENRTEEMFVTGAAQHHAKQICRPCPIRRDCLTEALNNQIEWGVWGGMTEHQRRKLLKTRPDIKDWAQVFT